MTSQQEDKLITRMKEEIGETGEGPVRPEALADAEAQLGFELPCLIRRLYTEVNDGGFAVMFPLYSKYYNTQLGDFLVDTYQEMRTFSQETIEEYFADVEEKPSLWPERVLMIRDWGCSIYSCVDCLNSSLPVLRMDSNRNYLVEFVIESPSLVQWLEDWMGGKGLSGLDWEKMPKVLVASLYRRISHD